MKFAKILFTLVTIGGTLALDTEWWKYATIYQIYPRSFKDSDGDGIGDIKGIISKLDYLVEIGVDTIYMNPFNPSSGIDGGYDITDYKAIDPVYGTMEDFERLMKEMQFRGLRLITDLVINHSSDEHEWFQKSIDKIDPYTNYYVWADPKGYDSDQKPIPPNNWFDLFHMREPGSAWKWNDKRKQFYLHQCRVKQPDFNLRNEAVKNEIKDIMKFWLKKGVAGFRVDAPMVFLEDEHLRDNPQISDTATVFTVFAEADRTYNHPDTFAFLNELNQFLARYDQESGKELQTPLMGETIGTVKTVMKYFGTTRFPAFHIPFNFLLTHMPGTYHDARGLHEFLHTWLDNLPKLRPSNWALGNHDAGRPAFRLDTEYNSILLSLVAMLPGTCSVYYGEELSMGQNHLVRTQDTYNRVFHRTPMHWDDTKNAGFSTSGNTWLPVHPNYWYLNVQYQRSQENSSLNYFKDLMSLRRTDQVKYGDLRFHILSKWVLAFSRTYKGTSYVVVMNLGTETQILDLPYDDGNLAETLIVVASSPNAAFRKGFKIKRMENYPVTTVLRPHSVIVLRSRKILRLR